MAQRVTGAEDFREKYDGGTIDAGDIVAAFRFPLPKSRSTEGGVGTAPTQDISGQKSAQWLEYELPGW